MIEWTLVEDDENWDYEKVFYQVKLVDGTKRWVWPNAGKLTDVGFTTTSGQKVPLNTVTSYREADDDYFDHMDERDKEIGFREGYKLK